MFNKLMLFPAFAALIFLQSCSGENHEQEKSNEKPIAVTLGSVSSSLDKAIMASGQVEAAQTANVSTRMMGRITNVYVKVGDHVNKGQLLVTISDEDIKAKRAQTNAMIAETEAALFSAQKDYDRYNELYKQQSATQKELESMTLQYSAAKARVEAARQMRNEVNAMLSYSSITAPFSGVVTQKLAESGSIANPGMPLLTIEESGILQVSATITETDISFIKVNDVTDVIVKSSGKKFKGKIIQLNPSSQFSGGQYVVKISIPEPDKKDLYAGMYVSVNIPVNKPGLVGINDKLLIPLTALVSRDDLTGIYTVGNNNHALLRWLRTGKQYGDKVEVLSGLSRDEKFIASAEGRLYNGAPVIVK